MPTLGLLLRDFTFTSGTGGSNGKILHDSLPQSTGSHPQHDNHHIKGEIFMDWPMQFVKFTPNKLDVIKPLEWQTSSY